MIFIFSSEYCTFLISFICVSLLHCPDEVYSVINGKWNLRLCFFLVILREWAALKFSGTGLGRPLESQPDPLCTSGESCDPCRFFFLSLSSRHATLTRTSPAKLHGPRLCHCPFPGAPESSAWSNNLLLTTVLEVLRHFVQWASGFYCSRPANSAACLLADCCKS